MSTSIEKKNKLEREVEFKVERSAQSKLTIITSCNPHSTPTGRNEQPMTNPVNSSIQSPKVA